MNIRKLENLSKDELIELIKQEREACGQLKPISIDERLPPTGERVLFYDGNETIAKKPNIYHVDYLAHDKSDTVVNYLHNYTHWLPIPEIKP